MNSEKSAACPRQKLRGMALAVTVINGMCFRLASVLKPSNTAAFNALHCGVQQEVKPGQFKQVKPSIPCRLESVKLIILPLLPCHQPFSLLLHRFLYLGAGVFHVALLPGAISPVSPDTRESPVTVENRPSPGNALIEAHLQAGLNSPLHLPRCRLASNRQMPAETETFRLSTLPCIGMRASSSQVSRVSRRMPAPSAPSTQAQEPFWSMA